MTIDKFLVSHDRLVDAAKAVMEHWSTGEVNYHYAMSSEAQTKMMEHFIALHQALDRLKEPVE